MIKTLLLIAVAMGILFVALFMPLESAAEKWPDSAFARWWRKHMVSNTHSEDEEEQKNEKKCNI